MLFQSKCHTAPGKGTLTGIAPVRSQPMTLMALVRSYSPGSLPDRYVLFYDPVQTHQAYTVSRNREVKSLRGQQGYKGSIREPGGEGPLRKLVHCGLGYQWV